MLELCTKDLTKIKQNKIFYVDIDIELFNQIFIRRRINIEILKGIPLDSILYGIDKNMCSRVIRIYFISSIFGKSISQDDYFGSLINIPCINLEIYNHEV